MSNTPEGKVKAKVREIFKKHNVYYTHIPGSAYRAGAPDYIACCNGAFLAVECKAGKNSLTDLQAKEKEKIEKNYGRYLIINEINTKDLEDEIMTVYASFL